jgi:hypothetical protein
MRKRFAAKTKLEPINCKIEKSSVLTYGGTWQNSQLEVFAWRSPHLTDPLQGIGPHVSPTMRRPPGSNYALPYRIRLSMSALGH